MDEMVLLSASSIENQRFSNYGMVGYVFGASQLLHFISFNSISFSL